ncbi:MAG: hypothetical protein DWQ06_12090 [Calditrichaeota bacterium]|nr:MAG: hypothetical protein DWQ06_12090 [Calditrichota bacterium]
MKISLLFLTSLLCANLFAAQEDDYPQDSVFIDLEETSENQTIVETFLVPSESPLMALADSNFALENYEQALQLYNEIDKFTSNSVQDFELNFRIARIYQEQKQFEKAIQFFKKSIQQKKKLAHYANFYIANCFEKLEKTDSAKTYFELATEVRNSPFYWDSQVSIAMSLKELGDLEGSNKVFMRLLQTKKYSIRKTEFYFYIGENQLALGNREKAITAFYNGIDYEKGKTYSLKCYETLKKIRLAQEEPFTKEERIKIIKMLVNFGQYSEATTQINRYKTLHPKFENQRIAYYEGKILAKKKQHLKAIPILRNALEMSPSSGLASYIQLQIARSSYALSRVNGIDEYLKFSKNYPNHSKSEEAIWKVGWIHERDKNFQNAASVFANISKSSTSNIALNSRFREGFSYYKEKDYSKAISVWQKHLKKKLPSFDEERLTFWVAKSFEKLGEKSKSDSIFMEIASKPFNSYYSLKSFQKMFGSLPQISDSLKASVKHSTEINDEFLLEAILITELTKKEFGEYELRNYYKQNRRNPNKIDQLVAAYEKMGNYGKAIRIGITLTKDLVNGTIQDSTSLWVYRINYPQYFKSEIENFAKIENLDPELVYGIIRRESLFQEKIVSHAGARGLMQIMTYTGKRLAKSTKLEGFRNDWLFESEISVKLGSHYLRILLDLFDEDFEPAIASYNAGEHRSKQWIEEFGFEDKEEFVENIVFSETRNYVRAVLKSYWIYKIIWENSGKI